MNFLSGTDIFRTDVIAVIAAVIATIIAAVIAAIIAAVKPS